MSQEKLISPEDMVVIHAILENSYTEPSVQIFPHFDAERFYWCVMFAADYEYTNYVYDRMQQLLENLKPKDTRPNDLVDGTDWLISVYRNESDIVSRSFMEQLPYRFYFAKLCLSYEGEQ